MFGIGFPELLLILALALIVVGPDKLPDLARSIAKTLVDLKKTAEGLKDSMNTEDNPLNDIKPTLEDAAKNFKEHLLDEDTPAWKVPDDLDELKKANRVNQGHDHSADAYSNQSEGIEKQAGEEKQEEDQNAQTSATDAAAEPATQEETEKQQSSPAGEKH